ncbi:MAG: 4Fe-4S dicluster domain-containing protein [Endomicrobia bacterium]|nr:4Fe-4S dicluster domain-containing protein [Endomicrobiia bacterium]MDW8056462.1 4Fe-4S dicluster domain-containing protein [Elusimicrobiota bacterium]
MKKKVKRKIIVIDEDKCNGCGLCIPSCPEQALQIVETPNGPKARLVKEFYCDGLGACLGSCPTGALTIEERETEPYDEEATIARIKEVAPDMLEVHIKHMKEHAQDLPQHHTHKMPKGMTSCPSAQMMSWDKLEKSSSSHKLDKTQKIESELRQWPIQLHLVSPLAPYFKNADIMFVADCVPFAYANFHQELLKGKAIAIACPKLDEVDVYYDKIQQIIETAEPKSITVVNMEVPCCFGLMHIVEEAVKKSGKKIPVKQIIIGIKGEIIR